MSFAFKELLVSTLSKTRFASQTVPKMPFSITVVRQGREEHAAVFSELYRKLYSQVKEQTFYLGCAKKLQNH